MNPDSYDNAYYRHLQASVRYGKENFIAPNATLIGDIRLGDHCSVWYNAVLRGDYDSITIGDRTNVQEGAVFHCDPGKPTVVGSDCVIGHGAVIHGCSIGNNSLVGIRATVLNGAKVGDFCIIGAHALVTENMEIPDRSMVLGSPGKVVKTISDEVAEKLRWASDVYVQEMLRYVRETW